MSSVLPPENTAVVYDEADPKMLLRIIDGALGPGLVSLETLRQISVAVEAELARRIEALEANAASVSNLTAETRARIDGLKAVADAIAAEITARTGAVSDEAKLRADADRAEATARAAGDKANADILSSEATARLAGDKANADAVIAEAKVRSDADAAMQARLVTLSGTLSLAAGLSLVVGKTDRKVAVAGLKKGDGITVTPTVALPGNMTLGDGYCLADNELSLSTIVTGTLALSISTKTDIPLIVKALR